MSTFKIVATNEKRGIYFTLIPHKWEEDGVLYWPQHLKFSDREIVRSNSESEPDKNCWQRFECVTKCSNISTFKEAVMLEKRLTECIDSDAEELVFENMAKKKPVLMDRNSLFHNKASILACETQATNVDDAHFINYDAENDIILLDGNDIIKAAEHSTPNRINMSPMKEDLEIVKSEISSIKQQYAKININLDKIYDLLSSLSTCTHQIAPVIDSTRAPDANLLEKFNFPLSSCEELTMLNAEIRTNLEFKSKLITSLSQIGGTNGEGDALKIAYKLSDFLFNPNVLINYSWTGVSRGKTSEKLSFQTLESILTVIFDVLLLADNRHTRQKNTNIFKDSILKHAKKRSLHRRLQVLKSNENMTSNDNALTVETVEIHVDADFHQAFEALIDTDSLENDIIIDSSI